MLPPVLSHLPTLAAMVCRCPAQQTLIAKKGDCAVEVVRHSSDQPDRRGVVPEGVKAVSVRKQFRGGVKCVEGGFGELFCPINPSSVGGRPTKGEQARENSAKTL